MRFGDYITETSYQHYDDVGRRTKEISKEEAFKLLKTKCSAALKGTPIYRGIERFDGDYGYADPRHSPVARISRNTENYYTFMIDNSPAWKGWPKRSKSFICSTDDMKASGYGNMMQVFPVNGTKIGVCPMSDIFSSFDAVKRFYPVMSYFNIGIDNIFKNFYIHPSEIKSYKDLKKAFKTVTVRIKEFDDAGKLEEITDLFGPMFFYAYTSGDMLKYIEGLLDPRKNNFRLKKAGDKLPTDNEVWTEGPCVLVDYDAIHLHKVLKELI